MVVKVECLLCIFYVYVCVCAVLTLTAKWSDKIDIQSGSDFVCVSSLFSLNSSPQFLSKSSSQMMWHMERLCDLLQKYIFGCWCFEMIFLLHCRAKYFQFPLPRESQALVRKKI